MKSSSGPSISRARRAGSGAFCRPRTCAVAERPAPRGCTRARGCGRCSRAISTRSPAALRFATSGKPRLDPPHPLRFNLSHSGDVALLAVATEREVGVDVEEVKPRARRRRGASSRAPSARRSRRRTTRELALHRHWVAKEAFAKASGRGLVVDALVRGLARRSGRHARSCTSAATRRRPRAGRSACSTWPTPTWPRSWSRATRASRRCESSSRERRPLRHLRAPAHHRATRAARRSPCASARARSRSTRATRAPGARVPGLRAARASGRRLLVAR